VGVATGKAEGLAARLRAGKLERAANKELEAEVVSAGDWEL